jgi:hypothetical protein
MGRLLRLTSNTVAFVFAAAFLVACSSSGSQPAPAGPVPQQNAIRSGNDSSGVQAEPLTSPLSGEVLSASNVQVTPVDCIHNVQSASFTASGTAEGPYRGTFAANGSWSYRVGPGGYARSAFNESFTITTRHSTVSGTIGGSWGVPPMPLNCHGFGPATKQDGLTYSSGSWSGTARTRLIITGQLYEKFL